MEVKKGLPVRNEVKAGYKKTEFGVIPEDWEVKKLRELAFFTNGKAHEQFINENGEFIVVNSKFVSTNGEVYKNANINLCPLEKGDITMVMSDIPNGKALAKCYLIPQDNKYALNQRICAIRTERTYNIFLAYILNRNKYYLSFDSGTGQTNLRKEDILNCPISLPSTKEEQKAIAEVLSDTDNLIQALEKRIAKKRLIKQGAMQKLLTPKDGWEVKKLGEILKVRHGKSQKDVEDRNGQYPILGTGGLMGYGNQFLYDRESVLIGRKGTIDKPRYMDIPFWTVDTLFYTEIFKYISPKYLFYKFLQIDWYSYNEASGVPSLNAKTIENIEISLPPLEEQTHIATILSDVDSEIETLEKKLAKYKQLKQGLMQNLLTGKIRLV